MTSAHGASWRRLRGAAAIADDREQPCARRAAAKLAEGAERAKQRILDDVLAEHRVAGQIAREIIGAVEMRQDQLPEFVERGRRRARATRRRTVAGRKARREEEGGDVFTSLTTSPLPHALTMIVPVMCGCREQK